MSRYGVVPRYGAGMGSGRGDINGMSSFKLSRASFASIENFIADNINSMEKAQLGIDALARTMTLVIKGFAQQKSGGPVAPRHRSVPALAYRIPVQRITGAYFAGWTVKRIGSGHWVLYNDTIEAYLIEYGIHQRMRRPILKMSIIQMLQFIQTTKTGDRFLASVLAGRRDSRGRFQSFDTRLQTGFKLGLTAGDLSGHGVSNPNIAGPTGALP